MTIDLRALWDFDDPAGSEQRFRELAATADEPLATYALTQVARALGLQETYDAGHAVLDDLAPSDPEGRARVALERGRLLRSSGDPTGARARFESAATEAHDVGLEELTVDALHMVALVAHPGERLAAHHAALVRARAATDPAARDWDASLLNNIGMEHADAGEHAAALAAFEEALAARERIGDPAPHPHRSVDGRLVAPPPRSGRPGTRGAARAQGRARRVRRARPLRRRGARPAVDLTLVRERQVVRR